MQILQSRRVAGRFAVFVLIFAALAVPLQEILADTIVLRNGRRMYGKIIGQTRTTIRVRVAGACA